MTKRLVLAVAAATFCFPASSLAASSAGVILSVNAKHHALQLVDARHVVQAYYFRGRLNRVALGSRVSISYSGQAIKHLRVKPGRTHEISFFALITRIRAGHVVLRLGDRNVLRLPATVMRSASRRHRHLRPGMVVLVTETLGAHGARSVKFKSVRGHHGIGGSGTNGGSAPGANPVSGTIVELDPTALSVQTGAGSTLHFTVAASLLATLQPSLCDTVTVSYHRAGATLVADSVQANTNSALATCSNAGSGGGSGASGQDVVGTITQMTLTSVTVSPAGGGSLTISAGVDLSGGFIVGDVVDVTYNPSGGSLLAVDLQYQSQDAIGTVTYVSSGGVSIVIPGTNQAQTFTDDPTNGTFDGISIGNQIDVTYHLSAGRAVVDSVSVM